MQTFLPFCFLLSEFMESHYRVMSKAFKFVNNKKCPDLTSL